MDNVVAKLSEIENAANSIIVNTEVQKQAYSEQIRQAQVLFDSTLLESTTNTIDGIKTEAQSALNAELDTMNKNNELTLKAFQEEYDKYHESYAAQIIKHITEV